MEYMGVDSISRINLVESLLEMPTYLQNAFSDLSTEEITTPGINVKFSPIEQVWHLADLEREGFGVRIKRLLLEENPTLPKFNGRLTAKERNYKARDLAQGLSAFREARQQNIATLLSLKNEDWLRGGMQEGVGMISLGDIPALISKHDSTHKNEIEELKKEFRK